jgi:hypothetical protein
MRVEMDRNEGGEVWNVCFRGFGHQIAIEAVMLHIERVARQVEDNLRKLFVSLPSSGTDMHLIVLVTPKADSQAQGTSSS